jgi:hypothetical protein
MSTAITVTDRTMPSSQELLQAALRRSAQRGRQVARRRLLLRWLLWAARGLLLWLGLPLVGALGAWTLYLRSSLGLPQPAALPAPVSASAPWNLPPASDTDLRELQLRLDEAPPPAASAPYPSPRRNP